MHLVDFNTVLFEELVDMHYEMIKEVFHYREIGPKQAFYRDVDNWTKDPNINITICTNGSDVVGYTKSYINDNNGLYGAEYFTECLYVKPEYRNTRASHLLLYETLDMGKKLKLPNVSNVRIDSGFDIMLLKNGEKHGFNVVTTHKTIEKRNF